ncbi:hypothetical protein LIA77_09954 [Sarocladium implicatum]|nr:hypothetical protein LIA77_09954 [Sarocladium implicatum]
MWPTLPPSHRPTIAGGLRGGLSTPPQPIATNFQGFLSTGLPEQVASFGGHAQLRQTTCRHANHSIGLRNLVLLRGGRANSFKLPMAITSYTMGHPGLLNRSPTRSPEHGLS